jgi:signal transduction histidine kinase
MVQRTWSELTHPDDLAADIEQFNLILSGQIEKYSMDKRFIRKDGQVVWTSISVGCVRKPDGRVDYIIGLMEDISERKRAEEALRTERQRLHNVLETMPIMVCLLTPDYHVAFANRAFRDKFGESHGRHCYEYCFGKKEPCDFCEAYRVLKTGKPHHWQVTTPDGASVIDAYDFPFTDVDGLPIILEMDIDITERKRSEEELKRLLEQLHALSAHLQSIREEERTLIAREIHDELGQALTIVKMDLSWLVKRLRKDQKSLIDKNQSMLKLIDSTIQTVRKISTDLRPGILDDLGLVAAIEWQAQDFENRSGISCDFISSLEEIDLDRDRSTAVFRILQEILTNVTRHAKATHVGISLVEEANHLVLTVGDNGLGIRERDISNPRSLGLLGMRERALMFSGELKISGVHRKGTTVTVTIPTKKT